jgi:hypothetical protein
VIQSMVMLASQVIVPRHLMQDQGGINHRPRPTVVTPGASFCENAKVPSDAIVLFAGKDLSQWHDKKPIGPVNLGARFEKC